MGRVAAWLIGSVSACLALAGALWLGYGLYLQLVVARSPATAPVIRTSDGVVQLGAYEDGNQLVPTTTPEPRFGQQINEPQVVVLPPVPTARGADAASGSAPPSPAPVARSARPILPPTRLRIPRLGLDVPIVLADNDDLPRFKAVGWYVGSGYPGFRGNVVLFGHLNGPFETFGRLDQLKPGDVATVEVPGGAFDYRVTTSSVVPEDRVEVLAPTPDAQLTLLTCSGTFFPVTRDYSDRLVVRAALVSP